jgi:hypothetical protein
MKDSPIPPPRIGEACEQAAALAEKEEREKPWLAAPADMEDSYLVELSHQLHARACQPGCTEALHDRSRELRDEIINRLTCRKNAESTEDQTT